VSGCASGVGRLGLLVVLTWPIETLAHLLSWSETTTGSIFLVVLGLLAIPRPGRGRIAGTARVTRRPASLEPVRQARWAIGSRQGLG
jgi:hypothetical protein